MFAFGRRGNGHRTPAWWVRGPAPPGLWGRSLDGGLDVCSSELGAALDGRSTWSAQALESMRCSSMPRTIASERLRTSSFR